MERTHMLQNIENYLLTGDLSDTTRAAYRRTLVMMLAEGVTFGADAPDAMQLHDWLTSRSWSNAMQRQALAAVRGFVRHQYGANHPALQLRIKRHQTPPQRTLTADQADQLYQTFDTSQHKGRRDIAMYSLMLDCGLRAAELCSLQLRHVHLADQYLQVRRKGGTWHQVHYDVHTALDVDAWIGVRSVLVANWLASGQISTDPGALFCGIGGSKPGTPITTSGLRVIVRYWGQRIGIKLSPHDMRRTSATLAAEAGASDQMMMVQYGWQDASMVRRYTRRLTSRRFADRYSPVRQVRDS
jgi:integrase